MSLSTDIDLCGVVLAAGAGTRLSPLTSVRAKALCPVGRRTLLDRTLDRLAALGLEGPGLVAVNAHHLSAQIVEAVGDRAHVSVEQPQALGTAGAIAALRDWIDNRSVLVCNADAYLADGDTAVLSDSWSGERARLLVVEDAERADFAQWRFAGMSLLPPAIVHRLKPEPTGLYEVVWREAWAKAELELTPFAGHFVDCGTPSEYLRANLHSTGGVSAIGAGAVVRGKVTRSVVWPEGYVGPHEHLIESIRVGRDLTVPAPLRVSGGP